MTDGERHTAVAVARPGLDDLAATLDQSMIGELNAIVDRIAALACLPAWQQQVFETMVITLGARLQSERARRLELESRIALQGAELAHARRAALELTGQPATSSDGAVAVGEDLIPTGSPASAPAPTARSA